MHRLCYFLAALFFGAAASATPWQKGQDIHELFVELNGTNTTDGAAQKIVQLCSKDQAARRLVGQRLPAMIRDTERGHIWLNAVWLAGRLQVWEAIPTLIEALRRATAEDKQVDTNAIDDALAEMGYSSIPDVGDLLKKGDRNMKKQAVLILAKINSLTCKKVLTDHLLHEGDPEIRKLIEDKLASTTQAK